MGFWKLNRSGSVRRSRRATRSACREVIESLESRTLLTATLTSALAPLPVATSAAPTMIDLGTHFDDPSVTGTTVLFQTTQGNIPVELFDSAVPTTVMNFLHYVTSGEYNGTFIHRVVTPATGGISIVQGGGYTPNQMHIDTSFSGSGIPLEGSMPNATGTLAMARATAPNTATSEFFFNYGDDSSSLPPGTSSGYAVFGHELYNGQQTLNAIAALQLVNYPPVFVNTPPFVPVVNFNGGTVTPANLVILTSAAVVPKLSYTVSSDNPALVMPSISGGTLTLSYAPGQTGIADITVHATDLGGNVATSVFQVGVGVTPGTPANTPLGAGGAKQIRFTDADGTFTTLALTGAGTATVSFSGTVANQTLSPSKILTVTGSGLQLTSIVAAGTTGASTLTITGHGGNNVVEISAINTDGSFRSINARNTALSDLTVPGTLGSLILGSATGGTLTVSGAAVPIAMTIGSGNDNIATAAPIKSLTSGSYTGGHISAPSVSRINVKGALSPDINLTGTLGTAKAGSITGGTWSVAGAAASIAAGSIANWTAVFGSLGKLSSSGNLSSSTISSTGNITSISAGGMTGDNIGSGVSVPGAPATVTSFVNPTTIGLVRVGKSGFANTNIDAHTLGNVNLGTIQSDNAGVPFGLATSDLVNLTGTVGGKKLKLKAITTAAALTAALTTEGITPQDFTIDIL